MTSVRGIHPEHSLKYINGWSEKDTIVLRAEDGTEHRFPAQYIGYFKRVELPDGMAATITADDRVIQTTDEGDWLRVEWHPGFYDRSAINPRTGNPGAWTSFRDAHCKQLETYDVHSYEADLSPLKRHMADNAIQIGRPRRCYLDIETDSRVSFQRARSGEARVLSWAVVDESGFEAFDWLRADDDENERWLLEKLWGVFDSYDQIVAWNGDGFDFPVIVERSKLLRCAPEQPKRWLWMDQMLCHKRNNIMSAESGEEKQSFKLDAVAQALLGEGKHDFDASKTWEAWAAGGEERDRLVRYNLQDTKLLPRIEAATGYLELFQTLCEVCGVFPDTRGLKPTAQVDAFMLRLGRENGVHYRTKWYGDETEKKFRGAFVMPPKCKGIVKDIHVADFASLYPSVMLSWNLSPDTKIGFGTVGDCYHVKDGVGCISPSTGLVTDTTRTGILCVALNEALGLRKAWTKKRAECPPGTPEAKDAERRTNAYKTFANSMYGVCGTPYSRFYDKDISEATTQNSVWLIQRTMRAAEERGMQVVYGDTDSLFVAGATKAEFEAFVQWCNTELYPKELANYGCPTNRISLAYEKQFERIVFTRAKRYCNPPEAPIWMADMSFKELRDIQVGDKVVGWSEGVRSTRDGVGKKTRRLLTVATVVAVHRHSAPIIRLKMKSGRTIRCTPDHRWLTPGRGLRSNSQFITPKVGRELSHVVDLPKSLEPSQKIAAAWLGGIFDGEGSLCSGGRGQIVISQSRRVNPEVCERIESTLEQLGFDYHEWEQKSGNCNTFAIRGGRQARINFVHWCEPAKTPDLTRGILGARFATGDEIIEIENDGDGEVIGLTTTTGNYVAWGYASKNCGTYAHYKGKPRVEGSKPEIKGLEYKRGDTSRLARAFQGEVIALLDSGCEDVSKYYELVERWKKRVIEEPLELKDVVLSKSISRALSEYADRSPPAHVKLAKEAAERGEEVDVGSRIYYVVTDATTSPMTVIPASEFSGQCDRYYQWETAIFPPSQRLLEAAFPKGDWSFYAKARPSRKYDPRQLTMFGPVSS